MKRLLFFVEDWPLTPKVKGGAGALNYAHLELVAHSDVTVHLVVLIRDAERWRTDYTDAQPDMWAHVQQMVDEVTLLPLQYASRERGPLRHALHGFDDPLYIASSFDVHTLKGFEDIVWRFAPAVIWAEHLLPAVIAVQIQKDIPVIYGHHDWLWRIKAHRHGRRGVTGRIKQWFQRRAEETVIKHVDAVVGGSASELETVKQIAPVKTLYLPTTYEQVDIDLSVIPEGKPRIVHLGGMATTANRIGVGRFMDVVWPQLIKRLGFMPELHLVGSMEGAPAELLHQLKVADAVLHGFVEELSSVLRPFDLHVIPWEYDTGTRTRIPLIMNYAQVIVAHEASVRGTLELINGENCILVNSLGEMITSLARLFESADERYQMGREARQSFEANFTRVAMQRRLDEFLGNFH